MPAKFWVPASGENPLTEYQTTLLTFKSEVDLPMEKVVQLLEDRLDSLVDDDRENGGSPESLAGQLLPSLQGVPSLNGALLAQTEEVSSLLSKVEWDRSHPRPLSPQEEESKSQMSLLEAMEALQDP